jgi:hypothetical protein
MGFFYTTITLRGVEQTDVVAYLKRRHRDAYVSPTINDITVVYDREGEGQDTNVLEGLAGDLSAAFGIPAVAALLHDDDVFWYGLFVDGDQVDEYNSAPGYFGEADPGPPVGGDAARLARAFGAEDHIEKIDEILHAWDDDDWNEGFGAEERHQALAEALSLPPYAYSMGYYSIGFGNVPEGVDRTLLIKTP